MASPAIVRNIYGNLGGSEIFDRVLCISASMGAALPVLEKRVHVPGMSGSDWHPYMRQGLKALDHTIALGFGLRHVRNPRGNSPLFDKKSPSGHH